MESVIRMRHLGTMILAKAEQSAAALNEANKDEHVRYEARSRHGSRFFIAEVHENVCSFECIHAQGDECKCRCEGVNHPVHA